MPNGHFATWFWGARILRVRKRSTVLTFDLPRAAHVQLEVFDVNGRRVRTLLAEPRTPGRHSVKWDGTDDHGALLAAGIYLSRARAGTLEAASRRLVLLP